MAETAPDAGPVTSASTRTAPTQWTLADGRELLSFALPGHRFDPVTDRRPLPNQAGAQSELRFDRTTGQWVIIAAQRQDRTYKPPPDECPLCPGPSGLTSEVPAPDYDVVVFENRFASLSGADGSPFHLPVPAGGDFTAAPSRGRCEVICFSSDHDESFAGLGLPQARLVVEAWCHRTADLMARPGIEQVFCFENRGEEIGVTLTHPHGQIYGYRSLWVSSSECCSVAARTVLAAAGGCSPVDRYPSCGWWWAGTALPAFVVEAHHHREPAGARCC